MAESQERETASAGRREGAEGILFSLQALAGFSMGGLLAITITLGAGLSGEDWVVAAGRVAGFVVCGGLGGAALCFGWREGAWKSGALGFGLAFAVPALLAGPALSDLLALRVEKYGSGTFVSTCLAFAFGYGLAGALGASFLERRLALPVGLRFLGAGAVGGLIAAAGPATAGEPSSFSPPSVIAALVVVVLGHMTVCTLGGWLGGLALENDVEARRKPRLAKAKRYAQAAAGD